MGNKNKISVNILGQEYPLMSDDDKEYMQKVAYLVDDRMQEISNANKKLGKTMVAVLTALNLADDYVKASDEKNELETQVENLLKAVEENSFGDTLKKEDPNRENINNTHESEASSHDEDHENFLFFKQEIDELREKIEALSSAVMSRESDLEKSNDLINILEHKLSDNEKKLEETKNRLYQSEEELEEFIKEFDEATN